MLNVSKNEMRVGLVSGDVQRARSMSICYFLSVTPFKNIEMLNPRS